MIVTLMTIFGATHASAHDLSVTDINFGWGDTSRRRMEPDGEVLTLTMSNGEPHMVELAQLQDFEGTDRCGYEINNHTHVNMVMTGCKDETRFVTVAGHGSWVYETESGAFRRVELEHGRDFECTVEEPQPGDEGYPVFELAQQRFEETQHRRARVDRRRVAAGVPVNGPHSTTRNLVLEEQGGASDGGFATCTCPDGNTYLVAALNGNLDTIGCHGGVTTNIQASEPGHGMGSARGRVVVCAGTCADFKDETQCEQSDYVTFNGCTWDTSSGTCKDLDLTQYDGASVSPQGNILHPQLSLTIRYFYDKRLLELWNGDHKALKLRIRELFLHNRMQFRMHQLGREVFLEMNHEASYLDEYSQNDALQVLSNYLRERGMCNDGYGLNHILAGGLDGTGIAALNGVCAPNCFNIGSTSTTLFDETFMLATGVTAHEIGHNFGGTHGEEEAERNCWGYVRGVQNRWSECTRDRWEAFYSSYVDSNGQALADRCFRPFSPDALVPVAAGCHTLEDEASCVKHKDGRKGEFFTGSPCAWCCGKSCTPGGSKCEATAIVDDQRALMDIPFDLPATSLNGRPAALRESIANHQGGGSFIADSPAARPHIDGALYMGEGVAGGTEIWNVDSSKGLGPESCLAAVLKDTRCAGDYFTYVARGDLNCGCKGNTGDLSVRRDGVSDFYRILAIPLSPHTCPTTVTGQGEFGQAFGRGADATVGDCLERCSTTEGCVAIDFGVGRPDACRFYRSAENARIGDGGDHNRVFCSTVSTPVVSTPAAVATVVDIPSSSTNVATVELDSVTDFEIRCPRVHTSESGTFEVTINGGFMSVRRTDSDGGWSQALALPCIIAELVPFCADVGMEIPGNDLVDLPASTPFECQAHCAANAGCKSWTFNGDDRKCSLKSADGAFQTSPASFSAVSGPKACPKQLGICEQRFGTDCGPKGDSVGRMTIGECQRACSGLGFVHATHGNNDCRCLTGGGNPAECTQKVDLLDGLCTYVPASTDIPEFGIRRGLKNGAGRNTCPANFVDVVIGSHSGSGVKSVDAGVSGLICPRFSNQDTWLSGETFGDTFDIQVDGSQVTATRSDAPGVGWGMNLIVRCFEGRSSTDTRPGVLECMQSGVDYEGAVSRELALRTPSDCQDECRRDKFCTAWSWKTSQMCTLKDSVGNARTRDRDSVFGTMSCMDTRSAVEAAGLKNEGQKCWDRCAFQSGPCDWCGTGKCCRKGFNGGERGCEVGEGGNGAHVCVTAGVVEELITPGVACQAHQTEDACLAAVDGRTDGSFALNGCAWCCGEKCGDTQALCEPTDWMATNRPAIGRRDSSGHDSCPTGFVDIVLGPNQGGAERVIRTEGIFDLEALNPRGITCPRTVSRENWVTSDTFGDVFEINVAGRDVSARRVDAVNSGWGMDLTVRCFNEIPNCAVAGFEYAGSDLRSLPTSSAVLCMKACVEESQCRAWTWDVTLHVCFLKEASAGGLSGHVNSVSGLRTCAIRKIRADETCKQFSLEAIETEQSCLEAAEAVLESSPSIVTTVNDNEHPAGCFLTPSGLSFNSNLASTFASGSSDNTQLCRSGSMCLLDMDSSYLERDNLAVNRELILMDSHEECRDLCLDTHKCVVHTYNPANRRCYLSDNTGYFHYSLVYGGMDNPAQSGLARCNDASLEPGHEVGDRFLTARPGFMRGECRGSHGVRIGVDGHRAVNVETEELQDACIRACRAVPGATACEMRFNDNLARGCYVHTTEGITETNADTDDRAAMEAFCFVFTDFKSLLFDCEPGQGGAGSDYAPGADSTVEQCASRCQLDPSCEGFDFAAVSGPNRCRLLSSTGNNRYGMPGADNRQVCTRQQVRSSPTQPTAGQAGGATCGGTAQGAPCQFPFTYEGTTYDGCTTADNDGQQWCFTENEGKWGNCVCGDEEDEDDGTLACGSTVACSYYYTGIDGNNVEQLTSAPKFPDSPDDTRSITELRTVEGYADSYGVIVEAWLHPAVTGDYTFITNSDDSSEVYVATTGGVIPRNGVADMAKVVELKGCCQKVKGTVSVYMEAGVSYFLIGYMKEGAGGDNFRIGFEVNGNESFPIDQNQLGFGAPATNATPSPDTTCNRPSNGCDIASDVYTQLDCDGDGVLDHMCTNGSQRWLALSSTGNCGSWVPTQKACVAAAATQRRAELVPPMEAAPSVTTFRRFAM